jgi:CBS domain containing-hemolysin-like protein
MMDEILGIILFAVAFIINGLLAASYSALVNSHPSQLSKLRDEGQVGARLAFNVAEEATELIQSMRIARGFMRLVSVGLALISFTSLFIIEGAVRLPAFAAILLGSGLFIGISEFLIENGTLSSPEQWSLRFAWIAKVAIILAKPFVWVTQKLGRGMLGPEWGNHRPLVTEEEIMTLVDASEEGGMIEEEEKAMIFSIFQLGDTLAREVMSPRIDIQGLDERTTLLEATNALLSTGYSRAPIYNESIDNITGVVYIKDLLSAWRDGRSKETVKQFLREPYFIPEATKLDDLLAEMQVRRIHMAIVVDEYGGTAGVVTIEDIVEEIVGEIQDEFDFGEEAPFQLLQEGEFLFSGGIDLDDVNQLTGVELPKDISETLGGFIYSQLGRVPLRGEEVEAGGLHLIVEEVAGRRIRKVRATKNLPGV